MADDLDSEGALASPVRPRLIPIPAPWRLELCPQLCLVAGESADVHPTAVLAHAQMLPSDPTDPLESAIIRLTFNEPFAVRLIPGEDDMPFDVLAYDLPGPPLRDLGEGMKQWEHNERRWRETGWCECPGLFKVLHSPWMAELAQDEEGYHQYLVMGRIASVEVIATDWRWERVTSSEPYSAE